jgi:hypothetical protein
MFLILFFVSRSIYEIMWIKYFRANQATDEKWRKRIACWIVKSTHTHTQNMQYLLLFHWNNGCTNAPQCYVIRTLSVLLVIIFNTKNIWKSLQRLLSCYTLADRRTDGHRYTNTYVYIYTYVRTDGKMDGKRDFKRRSPSIMAYLRIENFLSRRTNVCYSRKTLFHWLDIYIVCFCVYTAVNLCVTK